MNTPARVPAHDPQTGELTEIGLPDNYLAGNQSLAISLAMAEVDQQITTARAFPRSIDRAVRNITALATLDEETAKECIYALPRAGKAIRGPSIRLAEIIQSQWGNNRSGTRVVHVDRVEKYVEAEGVFHDLETNSAATARVRRRLVADKKTGLITEDMITLTGNAAASIAKRNAILGGVPKAAWRKAYAAVEAVLIGDAMTMAEKRDDAMKAFAAFGVKPEQIFEILEIGGLDDIGPDQYMTLIGMHQALRSGEATVEEMFPVKRQAGDKPAGLKGRLDQLAGGADKSKEGTAAAPKNSEAGPSPEASEKPGESSPADNAGQQPSSDSTSKSDDGDPIAVATRKGRAAYRRGLGRKAIPAELKADGRGAELDAYLAGFDDEAAADVVEEE
ncbi:hypothetical protein GGQ99_004743 [Aminobacter niigataensis]|uniref:Uncharacterized protein n=1 Tax=Aminobacter niigataensis TaxID=83265 RepID=A0ABR6L835_9HYPH|nr:hypothetical protein [Aminobacter niigataensis]MBB4652959.1 hypothetical protein [Aminobacter niigataensis]